MRSFSWTDPQLDAINARGNVLVSAAAGSGKTAVLVERVMRMIESECDIDELLIVTFTRSAAAQMKEKIAAAIAEKLAENPKDARFRRQQILLEKAQITTIDAFCADVLKNNFQHLGGIDISMNYKNLDAAEFAVLSKEAADEVLERYYESADKEFLSLMDVFTTGKNDVSIYGVLEQLHQYTSAFADKTEWLSSQVEHYTESKAAQSVWGSLILQTVNEFLLLALENIRRAIEIVSEDEATDAVYGDVFRADRAVFERAYAAGTAGEWDSLYQMKSLSFENYPRVKKGLDEALRAEAKPFRDTAISAYKKALDYVVESEEEFAADNACVYPTAKKLFEVFERYETRLFEMKVLKQSFEFSDIAYLALQLLADKQKQPTAVAEEYRRKFKGILVDEYQDTNGIQDFIFEMISDDNLFVVGDVKQSIYRFRQAMPEIFIGKRKVLQPYEEGKKGGCILLKNNFRSARSITDFVNFLFKKLMSEELGDVDYNEDEYLIPGNADNEYEPTAPELHILDNVHAQDRKKLKKAYFESRYIAELIKSRVENEEQIVIDGSRRAVNYSDFCVLVRAKTHLDELQRAFDECAVPCTCVAGERLFDTPEIMLVMSFLRATDNPLRDVDLIAVMYSELFGFTAQELSLVRIAQRGGSFYGAVRELARQGNGKCADFLEKLEAYRNLAATNEPAEFLRKLYHLTALPEILGAGENGAVKKANLLKFVSVVKLYSNAGYYGLTGLVRFLERVKENNPDIASAYLPEGDSKVKIMTVHASKGLEFPVVIFAFTNTSNNHSGSNIVLNREYGIGLKAKDVKDNARYNTVAYKAVSLANIRSDIAEELRTLYVALTRAKSQLIITGTYEGKPKKSGLNAREEALSSTALLSSVTGDINKGWMRLNNNYLSWLTACAFLHPDSGNLRELTEIKQWNTDASESGKLKVVLPDYYPAEIVQEKPEHHCSTDAALKQEILEHFGFEYGFAGSESIESKKTPSALAEHGSSREYCFEAPSFVFAEKVGAAQRGTATHRFMEKVCSFAQCDVQAETAWMLEKGFLSAEEAEVIDKKAIERFFASPLAGRMAKAERLEREYAVAYLEYAGFFDETLPEKLKNEKVFVDGMIDAVFTENGKAVIVDYKTDRVKSAEELRGRYKRQMQLYQRAIEAIWGVTVSECHLYSFCLSEDIVVEF